MEQPGWGQRYGICVNQALRGKNRLSSSTHTLCFSATLYAKRRPVRENATLTLDRVHGRITPQLASVRLLWGLPGKRRGMNSSDDPLHGPTGPNHPPASMRTRDYYQRAASLCAAKLLTVSESSNQMMWVVFMVPPPHGPGGSCLSSQGPSHGSLHRVRRVVERRGGAVTQFGP